ncbi:hypothetical protein CJ030_MR2G012831 [Morella rubra]|uniref:Phorbol-ester/DAG-type domain-containing protein n=1 Tax=Morella rubra TaxID=262757 RepID=A0A6A1WEA5_9ROSI|nr:hypothetical protein CJ030_MR2G012831 [Morella rubra]
MKPSEPLCQEHKLVPKKELPQEEVGREKIICAVCGDPVSGPSYKCKECKYIVHESCNVPPKIQHSLHPESDHTLVLQKASTSDSCDECCKDCKSRSIYKCEKCPFKLDIECASRWPQSNTNNVCQHMKYLPILKRIDFTCQICQKESKDIAQLCGKCRLLAHVECATRTIRDPKTNNCPHEFVLINERILFKCQVCRDERKDVAYLCSLCQLLVHNECAKVRRTIKISKHEHSLTLTYSVRDVSDSEAVFCKLCSQRLETAYAAYYCQSCTFVAHFECATMSGDLFMTSLVMETKEIFGHTYLIEEINPSEIERADLRVLDHVSHEHPLTRVSADKEHDQDDKLCVCDACTQFIISDSFYSCSECNFNLHRKCARLPKKKPHPLHPHPLFLFSQAPNSDSGMFFCEACKGLSHGFAYRCEQGNCSYNLDVRCGSLSGSLKHEGHPHILFPVRSIPKCNACDSETCSYGLFCIICQFYLGVNCATLPSSARHRYDTHDLQLAYTVEDDSGEYYCLICEEERNPTHWFYYCKECNFTAHPKCVLGNYPYIKFGKTYTDKDHRHPVTFVREPEDPWLPCQACGEPFNGLALECRTCKFCVHSRHDLLLKNSDCLQKKDSTCEGESR